MKRIFIAINLPKDIKQKLGNLEIELAKNLSAIKWVKSENIHLTCGQSVFG